MSQYYNPNRKKNIYAPESKTPFKISRSKIDLFIKCPRCFYLDRRLGVAQPPSYPYSLNSAVDSLLKTEFDSYRKAQKPHPLMVEAKVNAVPYQHEKIDEWRDALHRGITYHVPGTNLLITGGIDDVWVTPKNELIIVDYKSTSKTEEVTLDADWQISYKRQMEIYQWLFMKNGFKVHKTGYFVYCNGNSNAKAFNNRIDFQIKLIPYPGDTSWVEESIHDLHKCLKCPSIPKSGEDCDYCKYREAAGALGIE